MRRVLKCASLGVTASLAMRASALSLTMPINACTNYKPRLLPYFDSCAEFSAVTGRNGCMKVKGVCPACVTYSGDHLQMWLPDFLVEVTPHLGRSVFAENAAGSALNLHLKSALAWWKKDNPSVPMLSNGAASDTSHSSFWHVRILPVPFGSTVNTFTPLPSSRGVGVPVCYSALSELAPAQWQRNLADLPFAVALAPLAIPACYSTLGAVSSAVVQEALKRAPNPSSYLSGLTDGAIDLDSGSNGCALPVPAKLAYTKNLSPSGDIYNPGKMCIGTLGGLLPRTGEVATNEPMKSALIAAVKFASLTKDHFGDSATGGWNLSDKWQLIYPPTPQGYCFSPGGPQQLFEIPHGVVEDGVTRAVDNAKVNGTLANVKSNIYVFAVWRRRETCQEPANAVSAGAFWQAEYQIHRAKNLAICSAASSVFPESEW